MDEKNPPLSEVERFKQAEKQIEDAFKSFEKILQEEIDREILEELKKLGKQITEEDYDRAMKGL